MPDGCTRESSKFSPCRWSLSSRAVNFYVIKKLHLCSISLYLLSTTKNEISSCSADSRTAICEESESTREIIFCKLAVTSKIQILVWRRSLLRLAFSRPLLNAAIKIGRQMECKRKQIRLVFKPSRHFRIFPPVKSFYTFWGFMIDGTRGNLCCKRTARVAIWMNKKSISSVA